MTLSQLGLAALSLSLLAGAASAQPAKPVESGDARNGQKLFMAVGCYQCHGTTGAGGGGAGPRLAPNPLPIAAFANQLRHPRRMPPYREPVMSEGQIADIHAYLASIPPGLAADKIPLLNR